MPSGSNQLIVVFAKGGFSRDVCRMHKESPAGPHSCGPSTHLFPSSSTVFDRLENVQVNFAYREAGEEKNALVKLRLCPK